MEGGKVVAYGRLPSPTPLKRHNNGLAIKAFITMLILEFQKILLLAWRQ